MKNEITMTLTSDKLMKLAKKVPEKETSEQRVIFLVSRGLANLLEKEAQGKAFRFFAS